LYLVSEGARRPEILPELPPDRPLPCEPQNNSNHVEQEDGVKDGEPDRQVSGDCGFKFKSVHLLVYIQPCASPLLLFATKFAVFLNNEWS